MLTLLKGSTKKANRLFNSFRPNPQRLKNLTGIDPIILRRKPLQAAIREIEAGLGATRTCSSASLGNRTLDSSDG